MGRWRKEMLKAEQKVLDDLANGRPQDVLGTNIPGNVRVGTPLAMTCGEGGVMADGLWTALSGLRVRQQRLDNLANRLANANTVGFRRQVHLSQEHGSSPEHVIVEQAPADMTLRHLPGDHVMVRAAGTQPREEEGVMNQTGDPSTWLSRRQGYFVVQDGNAQEMLTRDGRFRMRRAASSRPSTAPLF